MRKHSILLFLTLLLLLVACKGNPRVSDKDVKLIDYPAVVKLRADTKSKTVVVDVRSEEEFAKEHIPGAINIKLPEIVTGDQRLAEAKTIVIYDSGLRRYSLSNAGAKKMLSIGYDNVFDFRGGLNVWTKSGGATEGTDVK